MFCIGQAHTLWFGMHVPFDSMMESPHVATKGW